MKNDSYSFEGHFLYIFIYFFLNQRNKCSKRRIIVFTQIIHCYVHVDLVMYFPAQSLTVQYYKVNYANSKERFSYFHFSSLRSDFFPSQQQVQSNTLAFIVASGTYAPIATHTFIILFFF